jgi:PAS domain S-box-containing protein
MRLLLKYRLPAAAAAIFVAGLAVGHWGYRSAELEMRGGLLRDVLGAAAAFDAAELDRLTGTAADVGTPDYAAVKDRLVRYRQVDALIRFVYVFRPMGEAGRVIFLADSEPADSAEISLPGEEYAEAATSPGLQAVLRTGLPATEGPLEDGFGVWMTGYAAITNAAGEIRGVVGIDIAAHDWKRRAWAGATQAAFYTWLLLGLPLAGWVITRRQHAQREVIRNLFEAMEQSPSAVMIVDLQSRIEYANAGLCRQLGYARRELIARPWREFKSPHLPDETIGELVGTVRAGGTWSGEWLQPRRDGSHYPVRASISPVRRSNGELACFVAVFEDMTVVKQNEAVLREALERAEAGDRAKSQFLATMSHEVRTPLNGIVGFTNLLLDTPLSAEQKEYLQTIHLSAEAMIQLTGDMLDFARIEAGKFRLELQPCDPRECLEDVLDLLAGRAAEKKLELLHWVEDGVPQLVQADPGRLRQVLTNLIGNAVKFTEAGEVEVTLAARAAGPDWELEFVVRDTGPGIAPGQQQLLFKPFSQVDSASTRQHGGTGLGLAICRNLVQMMGGRIGVESREGEGSIFRFTIHAAAVEGGGPVKIAADLAGVRLAIAAAPGSLRRELVRLGQRWGALVTATTLEELPALAWDVALVDLDFSAVQQFVARGEEPPGLPREKVIGLVPLVLPAASRTALHRHFRLLVNKPVHHQALRALLGAPVAQPVATASPFARTGFGLQVLLVEDNPVNQRLMQRVLGRLDCQWTLADNGRIALDELARRDYDVVLMDLHMPVMDGLTAIEHIRRGAAGEKMREVWIIALTADAREEQRARVLAAGADDYLTKPLKPAELTDAFLRLQAARGSAGPDAPLT